MSGENRRFGAKNQGVTEDFALECVQEDIGMPFQQGTQVSLDYVRNELAECQPVRYRL